MPFQADGSFPTGWPPCSVRCAAPLGGPGYNSQPAGTPTFAPGENLTYTCMEMGMLSGDSASNEHVLTCGSDGNFAETWPECTVRCLVPPSPNGFGEPVGGV